MTYSPAATFLKKRKEKNNHDCARCTLAVKRSYRYQERDKITSYIRFLI